MTTSFQVWTQFLRRRWRVSFALWPTIPKTQRPSSPPSISRGKPTLSGPLLISCLCIFTRHPRSSQLYQTFDKILLLSQGQALYNGPGSFAPAQHFMARGLPYQEGYNVADYLLEIASDGDLSLSSELVRCPSRDKSGKERSGGGSGDVEKGNGGCLVSGSAGDINGVVLLPDNKKPGKLRGNRRGWRSLVSGEGYATTFLTQFEMLAGREWKILRRYVFRLLFRSTCVKL